MPEVRSFRAQEPRGGSKAVLRAARSSLGGKEAASLAGTSAGCGRPAKTGTAFQAATAAC